MGVVEPGHQRAAPRVNVDAEDDASAAPDDVAGGAVARVQRRP